MRTPKRTTKWRVARVDPGPGKESVWNYPRPPIVEKEKRRLEVWFAGVKVAETTEALRLLETGHAPTYYFPKRDVLRLHLRPTDRTRVDEWVGTANLFDLSIGDRVARDAAWTYAHTNPDYGELADRFCFHPARVEQCLVNGEKAEPQGFLYSGWVTKNLAGPFKGAEGGLER